MESADGTQTSYARWVRAEGVDVFAPNAPFDLHSVDLKPWPRRGGRGVYIQLADAPRAVDCYVCEIPPGQCLLPQRHPFEEIVLVLTGRGSTTLSVADGTSQSFEWKAGTLFAIPRNASYRHFNGSGTKSVRLVAVTTAPAIIDSFPDPNFVFDCRHDSAADLKVTGDAIGTVQFDGARGLDALDSPLMEISQCGVGGHLCSSMGTRGLSVWLSQLPPATYGKAHVHASDAYAIALAGDGCTLASPAAGERTCWRWQRGSLVATPRAWWRQHFNAGCVPARMVTLSAQDPSQSAIAGTVRCRFRKSMGGACIDYADEAPDIRTWFAEALARHGLESRMGEAYALETKERSRC